MSSTVLFYPLGEDSNTFSILDKLVLSDKPTGVGPEPAPKLDFPSLCLPSCEERLSVSTSYNQDLPLAGFYSDQSFRSFHEIAKNNYFPINHFLPVFLVFIPILKFWPSSIESVSIFDAAT